VSSRPYRAIGPPLALLHEFISRFRQTNHHSFITLYPVLKQVLGIFAISDAANRWARAQHNSF
ncbi:MAG: hypothetical protein WA603_24950, partial [Candidatus Acidiferrales bacterium]